MWTCPGWREGRCWRKGKAFLRPAAAKGTKSSHAPTMTKWALIRQGQEMVPVPDPDAGSFQEWKCWTNLGKVGRLMVECLEQTVPWLCKHDLMIQFMTLVDNRPLSKGSQGPWGRCKNIAEKVHSGRSTLFLNMLSGGRKYHKWVKGGPRYPSWSTRIGVGGPGYATVRVVATSMILIWWRV
jgi:hypothetical protein